MSIEKSIWTIGHSTRSFEQLIELLFSFEISLVVDVRSYPGSRRYPQFNKESLQQTLPENKIQYIHLEQLGGRRKVAKDSNNLSWRHPAFRGYADYMETAAFEKGIKELEKIALEQRTAFMCSEALWWRCHRSMISDYLKWKGWHVFHIMSLHKAEEHPYTEPAKLENSKLSYQSGIPLRKEIG